MLHTIFSYGLLLGNFIHSTHADTPSIVTPTPFTSTQWGVCHLSYCRVFDVSVAFDKMMDKRHSDIITPCNPLFTTVPVKLLLHGLLLYGLYHVNVLWGGGGAFSRSLSMSEPVKIISQAQLLPVQANVDVKSVKEDDAIVPVHLWKD